MEQLMNSKRLTADGHEAPTDRRENLSSKNTRILRK